MRRGEHGNDAAVDPGRLRGHLVTRPWRVVFHIKWHLSFELFVTLRGWMGIVPTVLPATTHHRAVKGSYKRSELVPFRAWHRGWF